MADYAELVEVLRECSKLGTRYGMAVIYMDKAADAIEELSKPRWIPVTERLPLLMTPVLITDGIEVDIAWMFGVPARWAAQYTNMDDDSITHWMELPKTPLPEPQKEETE